LHFAGRFHLNINKWELAHLVAWAWKTWCITDEQIADHIIFECPLTSHQMKPFTA